MQSLEHERRLAARERETLAAQQQKVHGREQDLRNREETFRRRLEERIEERLRDARREIDAVVESLKARTDTLASAAERRATRLIPTGETGGARAEARARIDAIGERLRTPSDPAVPAAPASHADAGQRPAIGDRVLVGAFGLEGIVRSLHDREAEIDVRGKRLRARIDELRVITPAATLQAHPARVRVNVDMQPREGSLAELNVIGCHVEEALTRTEKFLDEAQLGDLRSVRLIHGYGTGQLRRALAEFLQSHAGVANFAPAPPQHGGGGVTVVELKE